MNSVIKDLSSVDLKTKKAANRNVILLFIGTIVAIVISVGTYNDSESEKQHLNSNLDSIKSDNKYIRNQNKQINKDNAILRKTLNSNSIHQSNLITISQKKSAKQLLDAAESLKELINGTNVIPIFEFFNSSNNKIDGGIRNSDFKSAYNLYLIIFNFSDIQGCKLFSDINPSFKVISEKCMSGDKEVIGLMPILNAKGSRQINLPNFKNVNTGKYVLSMEFNSKLYYQEGIYKIINRILFQSTRILEVKIDKENVQTVTKSWSIKPGKFQRGLENVNWKEEFPDEYLLNVKIGGF